MNLPPLRLPERFAESWINAPSHVVARVALRPFCLWHRMLFDAFGLPWGQRPANGDAAVKPTTLHLLAAVQICATRYEEQPDFSMLTLAGAKTLWQKVCCRRQIARGFEAEMTALARYLSDFSAPPDLWEVENKERVSDKAPMGSRPPSVLAVATRLIKAGFGEARAWEMPEGAAHWYAATDLWLEGEPVPFITESAEELEAFRQRKARYQAAKAARKAKKEKPHDA